MTIEKLTPVNLSGVHIILDIYVSVDTIQKTRDI